MSAATHCGPAAGLGAAADSSPAAHCGPAASPGAATHCGNATKVKLCGMFRDEDIAAVNAARPDYVGFVVDFPRSHRSVTPERAALLATQVDQGIRKVGVFVDEPVEAVADLALKGVIDVAQLHGHEDDAYIARLRGACGVPVIQALRVRTASDVARAERSTADLVLLDNGQGTGATFDWTLVRNVKRPFMLAGGLGPSNVAQAVATLRPWGVDMSSGIETDGVKDPAKMQAAVAAVRNVKEG